MVGKEFRAFPSHLNRWRSPQEWRGELQCHATFPESPSSLRPFQGNLFSVHCLDFQAEDRLTPRWHVGQPCGKASWKSLVGKPRGKASWDSLVGKPRGKASWESLEGKPLITLSTGRVVGHCCYSSGGNHTCMPPRETRTGSIEETPEVPQDACQHWRGILRFRHRLPARS